MEEEDKTSYEASTFTIDISNLQLDDNGVIIEEDYPAYVHEWWHYIQDISTVTGQLGFYLWFRDLACMSNVTCRGERQTIKIPMERDRFNEVYSKYRRLYNVYCGRKQNVRIDNPRLSLEPKIFPKDIMFDGEEHYFGKCTLTINDVEYNFGALALQELNAYYTQKIAEGYLPNTRFNTPADSLPEFPYKVGDMLFEYYHVDCDLRTKSILSFICLDCLQAPIVFVKLIQSLSGQTVSYPTDRPKIETAFNQVVSENSHPNSEAYNEWTKDYNNWLNAETKQSLKDALHWYLVQAGIIDNLKHKYGFECFPALLALNLKQLNFLHTIFTTPLLKRNGILYGMKVGDDDMKKKFSQEDYDNAVIIWTHRRIYDLLKSQTKEDITANSRCPLYNDGNCEYIKNYKSDNETAELTEKEYDCLTAPWMVVKGEKMARCPYAMAAHSMGLWQNDLEINPE